MAGTLFVVATPIGNLEDITLRALRILRQVSLIAAEDTRRTAHLLAHYAITTPTTSLHEHNEGRKAAALVRRLAAGEHIALVSDAGTPAIADPGALFVAAALDAGIRVEPVPGASAVATLLSACGLQTEKYLFLAFPPTRSKDRKSWFTEALASPWPVVFFEAPHRIQQTLREIADDSPSRSVVVGRELTKAHEELVKGQIVELLPRIQPRGEFVVVLLPDDTGRLNEPVPVTDEAMLAEFDLMTEQGRGSRRTTLAALARKYRQSTNAVYDALERAKKSSS